MKILHYALGFPPYRTGGLTKYCTDLMLTQKEQGHGVALLWPGRMCLISKNIKIKKRKDWNGIGSFEVINPLPVSLDEGIVDIEAYTKTVNGLVYERFLKLFEPDIIHIHSLMGLHKEFLEIANNRKIRIVFTSHDYFGICPKVVLFHDNKICDDDHDCSDCVECNRTALSLKKIVVLQSHVYRLLKNSLFVKLLRRRHRQKFFDGRAVTKKGTVNTTKTALDYQKLRQYYVSMLEMMDIIHFNSYISQKVYEKYVHPQNSMVVPISHRDIKDHRCLKNFDHDTLKITYLGPPKPYKGFQFCLSILDKLWDMEIRNFELNIYSETPVNKPYIVHKQNGYQYNQLKEIFDNTDLLIAPSQWYETFGFTVLEALSYGVPVIVSDKVGAGDVVRTGSMGLISCNEEMLNHIRKICKNREQLIIWNRNILSWKLYSIDCVEQCYIAN